MNRPLQMNNFGNSSLNNVTRSLELFALPSVTPASISKIATVTQSDSLELRGKVSACSI